MSELRALFVLALIVCCAGTAISFDGEVIIELTGAFTSPSINNSSTWGWFNPSKYDSWQTEGDDQFGFAAARITWSHPTYPIMLGGEWYPKLEAVGTVESSGTSAGYVDQLDGDLEAYDLALGQFYGKYGRPIVTPWFGVTQIRINESRSRIGEGGDPTNPDDSSAQSRLWGVMGGADAEIPLRPGWFAIGTVVIRWAKGSRDAEISTESPPTNVSQSDDTSITMWGAEIGVRWDSTGMVRLAAGWRYRDWTYDDGPASFSGPFLRLGVTF